MAAIYFTLPLFHSNIADRARIVRALAQTGLLTEARALALEGLLSLK